jgi:hypothetical protein
MHFELEQRIAAPPDQVAAAYTNPAFYETLVGLPELDTPEVLSHEVDGDQVRMRIRYRLIRELSAAVRAVVDQNKLSWVEVSTHDLPRREVTFRMDPDNYADRFKASGSYRFDATSDGAGTIRHSTGDLSIRMPIVGRRVEQAIIDGLQQHLHAEAPLIERWVAQHGG